MADFDVSKPLSLELGQLLAGLGKPVQSASKSLSKEAFLDASKTASLHLTSAEKDTYQIGIHVNWD